MKRTLLLAFFVFLTSITFGQQRYQIKGIVTSAKTGQPLDFVSVSILNEDRGAISDSSGHYLLQNVDPGIYRVQAKSMGYVKWISPEFRLSSGDYIINISLQESEKEMNEIAVYASPFRKSTESPISLQTIGVQEIEKSPGANRDISRVVNSFPGVASTAGNGYRNDLIVRGGGPAENRFYLDGVEIPNINHFSTQGASGGPIGILNADFIREVGFYTGAFPVNRGNALSSVLDFRLQDGSDDRNIIKATVGASEVALGANGHIGNKTTYLVSARQSYLQLLFRALGMSFLPTFTDAQFKVKTRFSPAHELTVLGLGAIDNMRLNFDTDPDDESRQYVLKYLPRIKQNSFTLGSVYKHYAANHTQTVVVSHSFTENKNIKYKDNDESSEENLMLRYRSDENETHLRFENSSRLNNFTLTGGFNTDWSRFSTHSQQKLYYEAPEMLIYNSQMDLFRWGIFASAAFQSNNKRFSTSLGLRTDAADYNSRMKNPLQQLSPRLSLSWQLTKDWSVSGSIGRFFQLPAYTTLGYKDQQGIFVNRKNTTKYLRSDQYIIGTEYQLGTLARFSVEGFYKIYANGPLSLLDSIPLACKGTNYGVTGNEAIASTADGRAYGVEVMARWIGRGRFNLITSYTFVRSEFKRPEKNEYIPTAWDNRHLLTVSGTYKLPRNWDIGLKFRAMGGTPYTPYDEDKSSLVVAWDAQAQPYYDYSLYNQYRLKAFTQLDLRVDKSYYFKGVMLGFYLDLQNILNTKYRNPDVYLSTGVIDPATATLPPNEQRYLMKYIEQKSGTILPTLGITVEF